ncbi:helix-turn-helix domain-containing protein [Cryobacterium sp. PH31-L1]|uniref:helix-turn-helix transcriptional regulator n=1 Tax=Cryobacterium sp. PH31-L1 TaxID=3046199 RepID=UPI0024BA9AB2|nr:helix-turn-helix domain-containing protein [Cryobacterium sp. PH31-L1]MDJ0378435.1 helix-turn-helix domain-containing protein [Cryobacterium sp. PH31-L1]
MDTLHTFPGLEPVLTTSQLAAHLGVPVQTIHDLRHAHRGPRGFRVGREMRYRLSEVQHWVEAMESEDHAADFADGARR